MKRRSLLYLCGILIVGMGVMFSCTKKEVMSKGPDGNNLEVIALIKEQFNISGLQTKLSAKFNDSATIHWTPSWGSLSRRKVSDSVTFYYVPLATYLTGKNGRLQSVKTLLTQQFLVIKQRSKESSPMIFYRASYTQRLQQKDGAPVITNPDYDHFSGYQTTDNFADKRLLHVYENGVVSSNARGASGQDARIVCDQECTWFSYCSGADIGSGQYSVTVTYGRVGNPCDYPFARLPDCGFAGSQPSIWIISSTTEYNCHAIDDGDVPPPPPGGGGTGGGGDDGLVPLTPATPIDLNEQGTVKIADVKKYIKCFQDGKTASAYRVIIYAQAPSGGGVYKSNPITKSVTDVGHAFVNFTKVNTDGTAVSQTFGFYPADGATLDPPVKGQIMDDGGHWYDIKVGTVVNENVFNYALDYVGQVAGTANYDLLNYNCSSFAIGIGQRIGLNIPDGYRVWGTYNGTTYSGSCPSGLVEDMKNWRPNQGSVSTPSRATDRGSPSNGPCP